MTGKRPQKGTCKHGGVKYYILVLAKLMLCDGGILRRENIFVFKQISKWLSLSRLLKSLIY